MEINKVKISNFKGIKSFEFNDFGKTCEIVAKNGSGKSSIMQAVMWVLGLEQGKVFPRIDKQESKQATVVTVELTIENENVILERQSKPLFDGERKSGNKGIFSVDGIECMEKDYIKFLDQRFPFRNLMRYNLVETMTPWKELRTLIMSVLGLQDISKFADPKKENKMLEELDTLVGRLGLAGAVAELSKRSKKINADIDTANVKLDVADEIGHSEEVKAFKNKINAEKKILMANFEKVTKQSALAETAVLKNEERLEKELKRMLGGGIEVVLRAEMLNGNMNPNCSIMKNGVDFAQLSYSQRTLSQVNLWLNLCKAAGVNYPLWIDNYESIDNVTHTEIIKLASGRQFINMAVGGKEIKELTRISKGDL